ncbi:structural protein, partial [Campylobacter upsaliensis]|nr:structural protein [Campylobacter upsaliensis]
MLDSLNKINLAAWRENPNVAVEIARTIENASWQKSPFAPFMGRGQDRGVRT